MPNADITDDKIARAIQAQVTARGQGKSICPSEVARELAADWRSLMPDVRRVAQDMAEEGGIVVTQKGQPADAHTALGPIRLSLSPTQRTPR